MNSTKPPHSALFIPEILSMALEPLEKGELVDAALVCHMWSDIALDWLWRKLESLRPVLELLSPLEWSENGWGFSGNFRNINWERFLSYTSRIDTLVHGDERDDFEKPKTPDMSDLFHTHPQLISSEAIITLTSLCSPHTPLFPKLQSLEWIPTMTQTVTQLLPILTDRVSPRLRNLQIFLEPGDRFDLAEEVDVELCKLFAVLAVTWTQQLNKFQFYGADDQPDTSLRDALAAFLGTQNHLECLEVMVDSANDLAFTDDAFLKIVAQQHNGLREVMMRQITSTDAPGVHKFLDRFVAECDRVTTLTLGLYTTEQGEIRFETIAPLLRCVALEELSLRVECMAGLVPKNIRAMGEAWRQLTRFAIRNDPLDGTNGLLPLSYLESFAEFFSDNLTALEFDIVVDEAVDPTKVTHRFGDFIVIIITSSHITRQQVPITASFLNQLSPAGIAVYNYGNNGENWNGVKTLLKGYNSDPENSTDEESTGEESSEEGSDNDEESDELE